MTVLQTHCFKSSEFSYTSLNLCKSGTPRILPISLVFWSLRRFVDWPFTHSNTSVPGVVHHFNLFLLCCLLIVRKAATQGTKECSILTLFSLLRPCRIFLLSLAYRSAKVLMMAPAENNPNWILSLPVRALTSSSRKVACSDFRIQITTW